MNDPSTLTVFSVPAASPQPPAEFLPWDSDFFGIRIGRVFPGRFDASAVDAWRRENSTRCLYYLADLNDSSSIHAAENLGFRLMDIRSTFMLELPRPAQSKSDWVIRTAKPEELPALLNVSTGIFQNARFYHDPHFPVERVDAMYNQWLENHFLHPDTCVWVLEVEGQIPAFTSIETLPGGIARLSLTGVHPAFRNRGLASAIKTHIIEYYTQAGYSSLESITQGCNRRLVQINFSFGFKLVSQQAWLHGWFTD